MNDVIFVKPYGYDSNSYIIEGDGGAVVVDPSGQAVVDELKRRNLICRYVLLTHGHFDHVGACAYLADKGAKIYCGKEEEPFIFSKENLSVFGGVDIPPFKVSGVFSDGQKFSFCGLDFVAISTPGHTIGGTCYVFGKYLFSGDTLFEGSAGRTDLPGGNFATLLKSLKKLALLQGDYIVCPGHGNSTTLQTERESNPFLKLC